MYYSYLDTPIGELLLAGDDDALCLVGFPEGSMRKDPEPDWIYNEKPFAAARQQLTEYFAGQRREFDLSLRLSGTEFQMSVLRALQQIPYGETTSYAEIAERVGRPKAVRARRAWIRADASSVRGCDARRCRPDSRRAGAPA